MPGAAAGKQYAVQAVAAGTCLPAKVIVQLERLQVALCVHRLLDCTEKQTDTHKNTRMAQQRVSGTFMRARVPAITAFMPPINAWQGSMAFPKGRSQQRHMKRNIVTRQWQWRQHKCRKGKVLEVHWKGWKPRRPHL
jgi:hypothetical protein